MQTDKQYSDVSEEKTKVPHNHNVIVIKSGTNVSAHKVCNEHKSPSPFRMKLRPRTAK